MIKFLGKAWKNAKKTSTKLSEQLARPIPTAAPTGPKVAFQPIVTRGSYTTPQYLSARRRFSEGEVNEVNLGGTAPAVHWSKVKLA